MLNPVPSSEAPPILTPAWKQVTEFTAEISQTDEWEEEEEVEYITFDFGKNLLVTDLGDETRTGKGREMTMVGIEGGTPFVQIGSRIFRGYWERLIGNEIVLQLQGPEGLETYIPVFTTKNRLVLKPVTLVPKTEKEIGKSEEMAEEEAGTPTPKKGAKRTPVKRRGRGSKVLNTGY